jgi:hypothetical protein
VSYPHNTGPQRHHQYPPQQQYGQPQQSWEQGYQAAAGQQWDDQYNPRVAPQGPRRRQAPPPAPKKKWPWVVGGIVGFLVLVSAINGGSKSTPTVGVQPSASGAVNAQPADQAQLVPSQAPAAPAGPGTTMGAGTYEVGPDIVPGRYKTQGSGKEGFFGSCYFQRAKNDSGEFSAIISNDFFQGPGSVTVKKGEFLKLTGECVWTKQ